MTEHGIRFVRWRTRDIVLGMVALLAISVMLIPIGLAVHVSGRDDLGPAVTLASSGLEALLFFVVWRLAVRRYPRGGWAAIGFRSPGSIVRLLVLPVILFASLGFTALYEMAVELVAEDWLMPEPLPSELFGEGVVRVMIVASIALLIPVVEEMFFRGFLFVGLAARFGVPTGIVLSAAVFAAAHLDVRTMVPIFVSGLLFGWAYNVTKTLWVPIAAHAFQNLAALMFLDIL